MERSVTSQNEPATCVASRVPPELMDAIIDAGKNDKRFLKTCGLVCRAWVPASRHHLFERITVCYFGAPEFNRLLQSELVTFPRHIRHLELDSPKSTCSQMLSQLERIGSFQSLTKLCISDTHHYESFDDLAKFLLMCNVLEDLSLVKVKWRHQRASKSVPPAGSLPLLRFLAIRSVSVPEDVIAWLLSLQPVPALQFFAFHSRSTKKLLRVQLNTLSQALGPSLQHLGIYGELSHLWEFSHSTELHTVTFGLDLDKERYSLTAILPSLEPIISSIRDVVFDFSEVIDWDDENCNHLVNHLYDLDFEDLDEFLCQPQFLTLQTIRFHFHERDKWLYDKAKRMLEEGMPASLSRGILSIQNDDT